MAEQFRKSGIKMQNTSDIIELFLKELIEQQNGELELKRNELAGHFNCAPSQINYVLSTRFTVNRGYVVTSRKGGGGYIRITSIDMSRNEYILHIIERIGESCNEAQGLQIVRGLYERNIISEREAKIMAAAIKDDACGNNIQDKAKCRAQSLKGMLLAVIDS